MHYVTWQYVLYHHNRTYSSRIYDIACHTQTNMTRYYLVYFLIHLVIKIAKTATTTPATGVEDLTTCKALVDHESVVGSSSSSLSSFPVMTSRLPVPVPVPALSP
mmetsp:Transcript_8613/g.16277  ORF Transcript_8613/g.16277 Transcript_8613/m.16277 type:complete len:105 (-) Transcript_8613:2060-2374(-)